MIPRRVEGGIELRYETHTQMKREAIFEAAKGFFGQEEGGLGMKLSAHQGNQIAFFGDGLIWVTVWPAGPGKKIRVDVDVSERDADAKRFIEKVLNAPVMAASGSTSV
ncbi:MAG: hypothetical protein QOH93_394 [Chloroflexia bacterium]|nr:hypothetical protein [Chloroflexia bacterium]